MVKLLSVPIFVADQERALAFYRDRLGLVVVMDIPMGPGFRWLVVAPPEGGTELILYCPQQASGADGEAEIQRRVGSWTGIIFATDDIDATYHALREHGVAFEFAPRLQPWGVYEAVFRDVDGNRLHLVQRPEGFLERVNRLRPAVAA